jgi:hypothetical protein
MPQEAATPPVAATPVTAPAQVQVDVQTGAQGSPREIYRGFRAQRQELGSQLESLEDKRRELTRQLQSESLDATDKAGIQQRISDIDQRIRALDQQIAASDASVARSAALPGATVEPPPPPRSGPPEEVFVLSGILIFVVVLPLTIAYARRIWRKGAGVVASIPKEIGERLTRIEQAIDAMAVEVERVGEGQRYMTRQMGEQQRALGAGAAEPVALGQRDREAVGREGR